MTRTPSYAFVDSPVGRLLLVACGATLTRIEFENDRHAGGPGADGVQDDRPFVETARQLDEYFAGRRRQFDLDLAPAGTPFQRSVWHALQEIPYGETRSYAEIAACIDRPRAVRAVGAANGQNPLPIVIPCHRVIGSNGDLTGFGGGLEMKRRLLQLEGVPTQKSLGLARGS